jgi:hypothetical protein
VGGKAKDDRVPSGTLASSQYAGIQPCLVFLLQSFPQKPGGSSESCFLSNSKQLKSVFEITTYFGSLGYFLPINIRKALFYVSLSFAI